MPALGFKSLLGLLQPKGESLFNLGLMRLIDGQFLETPFYGTRQMKRHLVTAGYAVGRRLRFGLASCPPDQDRQAVLATPVAITGRQSDTQQSLSNPRIPPALHISAIPDLYSTLFMPPLSPTNRDHFSLLSYKDLELRYSRVVMR